MKDFIQGKILFLCKFCDHSFRSSRLLWYHKKTQHLNEITQNFHLSKKQYLQKGELIFSLTHDSGKLKQVYKCDLCNKSYAMHHHLFWHTLTHLEEGHQCHLCSYQCNSHSSLKSHMNSKHYITETFHCDQCGKSFSSKRYLAKHKLRHLGLKFTCEICGAQFTQKDNLKYHQRIHTGNTIKCDFCGKRFIEKQSLLKHMTSCAHKFSEPLYSYNINNDDSFKIIDSQMVLSLDNLM